MQAAAELDPDAIILDAPSRDQLDRYHEVRGLAVRLVQRALAGTRATVVAVADDPNVPAWSVEGVDDVRWVDVDAPVRLDSSSCPACAHLLDRAGDRWHCPNCGRAQVGAPITAQRDDEVTVGRNLVEGRARACVARGSTPMPRSRAPRPTRSVWICTTCAADMATVREVASRPTRVPIGHGRQAGAVLVKQSGRLGCARVGARG